MHSQLGYKRLKHFLQSLGTFSPIFSVSIIGPSPSNFIVSLVNNSNLYPVLILKVTLFNILLAKIKIGDCSLDLTSDSYFLTTSSRK